VTWRVKHQEWAIDDMAGLTKATGYEAHGIVADPGIEEVGPGLLRLSQKGAAWEGKRRAEGAGGGVAVVHGTTTNTGEVEGRCLGLL